MVSITSTDSIGDEHLTVVRLSYFKRIFLDGKKMHAAASWKKIKRLESAKPILTEGRSVFPLHPNRR